MHACHLTLVDFNGDLRLRRLICGKASPFRWTRAPDNLLRAGWKAEPSSLRGAKRKVWNWPESRRLSARQGGRAAVGNSDGCWLKRPGGYSNEAAAWKSNVAATRDYSLFPIRRSLILTRTSAPPSDRPSSHGVLSNHNACRKLPLCVIVLPI